MSPSAANDIDTANVQAQAARSRLGNLMSLAVVAAGASLIAAGVLHVAISPIHWQHAAGHGIFHLLSGIGEVVLGVAFLRRPRPSLAYVGTILAGSLVTLIVVTRILPAPFEFGPEEYELTSATALLLQGLAIISLIALLWGEEPETPASRLRGLLGLRDADAPASKMGGWSLVSLLVASAVGAGILAYAVAEAVQPALPWLGESTDEAAAATQASPGAAGNAAAHDTLQVVVGGIPQALTPGQDVPVAGDVTARISEQVTGPGTRALDVWLLHDGDAQRPVEDGRITTHGYMRFMAHGGVGTVSTAAGGGHYLLPLQFTMAGDWQVDLDVTAGDQHAQLSLDMDVE
ncbi:MAG: FixH family protein [Chloroflexota bacterium]|nr:FixH family protein [Chloroflexota bacterium]